MDYSVKLKSEKKGILAGVEPGRRGKKTTHTVPQKDTRGGEAYLRGDKKTKQTAGSEIGEGVQGKTLPFLCAIL